MLRLHANELRLEQQEFLESLFNDLKPLGHFFEMKPDGFCTIGTHSPLSRPGKKRVWHALHKERHKELIQQNAKWITEFEHRRSDIFCDMATFSPSSVDPRIEVVTFTKDDKKRDPKKHKKNQEIVEYLRLNQVITSNRLVGRKCGLLIWDEGQSYGRRPLIGAAIMSDARYSQRIRDVYLDWPKVYPQTSENYSEDAKKLRRKGLDRLLQLSIACALPPYSKLKGAWLAAAAPFTKYGQNAIERASAKAGADLIALVTTTGLDVTGAPFQKHRLSQLAPAGVGGNPDARGNLYYRIPAAPGVVELRANFMNLVSGRTWCLAEQIFQASRPEAYEKARNKQSSAMSYLLRDLGLHRSIFDGNTIGVHIGSLGERSLDYLKTGEDRPEKQRPRLEWKTCVDVWTRSFLPLTAGVRDPAQKKTRDERDDARRKRLDRARSIPQSDCKLSTLSARPITHPEEKKMPVAPAPFDGS